MLGVWEQQKLGDIGKTYTGLSGKSKTDFGHGKAHFVTYMNVYSHPVADINQVDSCEIDSKQHEVQYGDVFFTTSSETPDEVGMSSVWLGNTENTYLNSFCFGYRPDQQMDPYFTAHILRSPTLREQFILLAQGISRYNISKNKAMDIKLSLPSLSEQRKIGSFFNRLDGLINLHQRQTQKLRKLKQGLLQEMFPREGESVPRLRFPGFTTTWKQRKFGDLADYKKGPFGSAITKNMFVPKGGGAVKVYEQQNAINKDWSLERYFLPKEYALTKLKSFEVHGGDIIVSCAGTIGEIYEIPEVAESGVINQALMRVRVNESIVDKKMFIISFSNMIDEFTRTHSNGSAIKNIPPFADLKPMEVLIPSINEQRKISGFFEGIDNLIGLHERYVTTLIHLKKGLLQKMFPQD